MPTNEIIGILHNLAVELEIKGQLRESVACSMAVGMLMIMKPADFELIFHKVDISDGIQPG